MGWQEKHKKWKQFGALDKEVGLQLEEITNDETQELKTSYINGKDIIKKEKVYKMQIKKWKNFCLTFSRL